jgi:hypothetical protein
VRKPPFIRIVYLVVTILVTCLKTSLGQYASSQTNSKWNSVKTDNSLSNILFVYSTMFRDSSYLENGDTDDFNVPIGSNIYAWGSCYPDTLLFCNGNANHDTITINIGAPSMCCMDRLAIYIYKNKFASYFLYSYDIAPDAVLIKPIVEELVLKNAVYGKGGSLEGYINFMGTGIDTSSINKNMFLLPEDTGKANNRRIDTVRAKGYFKCIIK